MKTIFLALLFLTPVAQATYKSFNLVNPPMLGATKAGQKIFLGGVSGMHVVSQEANVIEILAITDRGPNAAKTKKLRPFVLPEYGPRILRLRLDRNTGQASLKEQIVLRDFKNNQMSGLPPYKAGVAGKGEIEIAVDLYGNELPVHVSGIDPEGFCVADDGHFWISEEYGPDLLHFSPEGVLLERLTAGAGLPDWVARRKSNNGFEGLACDGDKLFALLQTPLKFEGARNKISVRLIEIDRLSKKTTGVYLYKLEAPDFKIGDLARIGPRKFIAIEQNGETGKKGIRGVYEIDLVNATNLLDKPDVTPELLSENELTKRVRAVKKTKILDLAKAGFDVEKAEALAMLPNSEILIGADNDFGLNGEANFKKGTVPLARDPRTQFGLFNIQSDGKVRP